MLFDTHAHLNDPAFDPDREELMAGFRDKGIGFVMNAGCSLESSKDIIRMAEAYPWLYASVGSHPDSADEVNEAVIEEYRKLCRHEKVKAIGEIGLDYYYDLSPRDVQKEVFVKQLLLARELEMPAVFHVRDAHGDVLDLLRANRSQLPAGVVHCYSGSVESAREYLDMGFYISFAGPVTFKKAPKLQEAAVNVPLDRLLIETDCPYMAPEPFRGKRNDPGKLYRMAERLAEIRGMTLEEIHEITTENGKRLYRI